MSRFQKISTQQDGNTIDCNQIIDSFEKVKEHRGFTFLINKKDNKEGNLIFKNSENEFPSDLLTKINYKCDYLNENPNNGMIILNVFLKNSEFL